MNNTSYIDNREDISVLDYACWNLHPEYGSPTSHRINFFITLILIIIGLTGNMLCIVVFSIKGIKSSFSTLCLFMLAVSDSAYLVSVFLTKILTTLRCLYFTEQPIDVFNRSHIGCKLLQYFLDLFSDYSTCLIFVCTVDRYIACHHLSLYRRFFSSQNARIFCSLLFIVCGVGIAPYHFMFMKHYEVFNVCTIDMQNEHLFTAWYITEMVIFRIIPVIGTAILTMIIVDYVKKRIHYQHSSRSEEQAEIEQGETSSTQEENNVQLTIMLLLVSSTFILVYLPVLLLFVLQYLQRHNVIHANEMSMTIARDYAATLYVSGFASNFFLFTLSGNIFRRDFRNIFCKKQTDNSASQDSAASLSITEV